MKTPTKGPRGSVPAWRARLRPRAGRRGSNAGAELRGPFVALLLTLVATPAFAAGYTDLGDDIAAKSDGAIELDGYFRARGEALYNLDLDRGVDANGEPLYPVPLANPDAQTLTGGNLRLRTDFAAYTPLAAAAVKARIDILDNLAIGSRPDGPPAATVTQEPVDAIAIRRVYAEVLTPFGLVAVGRIGSHFGTGMLANGGDCADCDSGDAADRIAWIAPLARHVFAVSYDVGAVGPSQQRARGRVVDIDPADDVRGINFAILKYRSPSSTARRLAADRSTLDYGAVVSHRWQRYDVPASYVPTTEPVPLDEAQVIERGLTAWLFDAYVDFTFPFLKLRAEGAYLTAVIEEPSIIPGVRYGVPVTSDQWGAVLETRFGAPHWRVGFGVDAGIASGDAAYGFGADPQLLEDPPVEGELDGPQANPPFDTTVNNFRFHPDYRVDRILFREIIGTVTDAAYVRPHFDVLLGETAGGVWVAEVAGVVSQALYGTSTPSGEKFLGVEIDPAIRYENGRFEVAAEYALFLPGAAFDNPSSGLTGRPAQLGRLRLNVGF